MNSIHNHGRNRLALSILSVALLGAMSTSAFAADDPCKNPDGSAILPAPGANQGA